MADLDFDAAIKALDEQEGQQTATQLDPDAALKDLQEAEDGVDGVPMDPELRALLDRNPQIKITGQAIDDPRVMIGGRASVDVTDEVRAAAAEAGPRDYEYFYGTGPEKLGLTTRVGAMLGDLSDFLTPGEQAPNDAQQERDRVDALGSRFMSDMQELYDNAPAAEDFGLDGGSDVKVMPRLDYTDDGKLTTEYVRIPAPNSSAFERVVTQAGRNIYQQLGGLVTEGAVVGESELERKVPDLESQGLEALMTDVLTYGTPAVGAEVAGAKIARGLSALAKVNTLSRKYRAASILGGSLGAAASDAIMSTEDQQGLLVRPEYVQDLFKIDNPEAAANVAMFMDGMILNGAFDSIVGLIGKGAGLATGRVKGVRALVDPTYVRRIIEDQSIVGTLAILDPALVGADTRTLTRSMRDLSLVLDANTEALIQIGQTSGRVPLDTVNSLANGAEMYIATSRANLRKGMTQPEWDEYVRREGAAMVERAISLARSQEGSDVLRTSMANMSGAVDRTIMQEADRLNPDTPEGLGQLQTAADDLVNQRTAEIADASNTVAMKEADIEAIRDRLNKAVEQDPFIGQLLASDDPLRFMNNSSQVERLQSVLGKDLFEQYRTAWRNVSEAYADIPNVPVDMEMFIADVTNVVRDTNILDNTGGQTKRILGEIYSAIQPQARQVDGTPNPLRDPRDAVPTARQIETPEQLAERLNGEVGFQDLYRVRQKLSNLIAETNDPAVKKRLIELKDSIVNPNDGQLAFVMKSGGQDAADAAMKADRLYMDTMARFQNSEPMRQYSDLAAERAAGVNTDTSSRFLRRGEADLNSGAVNQILPTVANDITGTQYTALRQAFDDANLAATLDSAVADLYIAQGVRELSKALRGASTQSPEMIINAFEEQARILRSVNNPVYTQLEDAAARIRTRQKELGDDLLAADDAAAAAREGLKAAEDTIVQRLLNKEARAGTPPRATTSVNQKMSEMLSQADAGDAVEALMAEVRRLPDGQREAAQQALQGSLLRAMREKVFSSTPTSMDTVDVRMGNLTSITREVSNNVLGGIRAAFPDNPEVVEGVKEALTALHATTIPSRVRVSSTGSPTAANLNIRENVSAVILFSLGYMNPTAAGARKLTEQQIRIMEGLSRNAHQETMATILAAPQEFASLLRAVADRKDPSTLTSLRRAFLNSATDALRYDLRVEPNELFNNTLITLEDAMNRTEADYPVPDGFEE